MKMFIIPNTFSKKLITNDDTLNLFSLITELSWKQDKKIQQNLNNELNSK